LKILRHIFLVIFLGSMLYTVFNYLPLIEEETPSKKFELVKKAQNTDEGEGGVDDEDEKGAEDLFHMPQQIGFRHCGANLVACRVPFPYYLPPSRELNTPPPRQAA
jgi:hypothetical protein